MTHPFADVTGDATIALAVLTAVLAAAAIWSGAVTYRALEAARRDTVEATKARIDQQAPRVTFVADKLARAATWPVDGRASEVRHGDQLAAGAEVGIAGQFWIRNDGSSTALIEIPPGVIAIPPIGPIHSLASLPDNRPAEGSNFALEPGKEARLLVWACRSTREWRDELARTAEQRGVLTVTVTVTDTFADGVSDSTDLVLHGVPVHTSGTDLLAGEEEKLSHTVKRTRRTYPNLSST